MLLFFISLILVILTGFFVSSIFEQKNFSKIFIYFMLTMFATVVLNIEILSLFSKISEYGILTINLITAFLAGYIWNKKNRPIYSIKFKRFFKRIYYTVMSDKYLLVLGIAFLFMCAISLFLISFLPVINRDAEAYHVLRSLFWLKNGNLNHFAIADIRNLVMPINSEILYLWIMAFMKKQIWLGIFSFVGFLLSITSLHGILTNIKISERHKLWVIFMVAALPSVIVQISGTETDIIIAGLVLTSIYLYWNYLKNNKLSELYFSALAYALAIGTKSTSLVLVIPVGLWMIWQSYNYFKKNFYKPFSKFLAFGLVNFIFFASYNYILNFLDYGNIFGSITFINIHSNLYGIKGAISGFIKHIFLFFDFTGFKWNDFFGLYIAKLKLTVLSMYNLNAIPDGLYSTTTDFRGALIESTMGLGVLGLLLYLPYWIYSFIAPIFSKKKSVKIICSFGLILLVTLIVMSYKIVYMYFSIRFLTAFCVICSPVLILSYTRKNNIYKFIITIFALYSLFLISTHLWGRPFKRIVNYLKAGFTVHEIREICQCSKLYPKNEMFARKHRNDIACEVNKQIRKFDKSTKILIIPNQSESLLLIKNLDFEGYNIDYALLEDGNNIDFSKYDVIIKYGLHHSDNVIHYIGQPKYFPTKDIECVYLTLDYNTIKDPSKDKVALVTCNINNEEKTLNKSGFKIYSIIKTNKDNPSGYTFYVKSKNNN